MKKIIIIVALCIVFAAAVGAGIFVLMPKNAAQAITPTQLSIGEKYLAELKYEPAAAALQEMIEIEPNNSKAYLSLAKTYNYMGDIDAAIETLKAGYEATGSSVIRRELDELEQNSNSVPVGTSDTIAVIEIAGQYYRADATELVLRNCGLTKEDLAKLSAFTNLQRLDISDNNITDISDLAGITTLKKLYAANNSISDVSPLASLSSLEYAGLRNNDITNADVLFSLENLKYLHLSGNKLTSVPDPGSSLKLLYLADNRIADVKKIEKSGLLYYDISGNK